MRKAIVVFGILLFVGLILGLTVTGSFNGLIDKRNAVDKAWADVESAYQRRIDTIPKFVKNAQFSADFQVGLINDYVKGRKIDIANAASTQNPETLRRVADDAYKALMIVVQQEAVPQAKLDQFTELNAEIENIERVINHERKSFNDAGRVNNNAVQSFPNNFLISLFGWDFKSVELFKAEPGAEKSPDYEFKLK